MKNNRILFVLITIVSVVLLICFVITRMTMVRINDRSYLKSFYSMPSHDCEGEVYLDKNIEQTVDLEVISDCLVDNEKSHGIKYKKPIKIIICKDDKESAKVFSLFKTKASGFAFSNDLIIVNYDNLYKLGYTFDSIIRHESSHTLIKQNIESFFAMIVTFSKRSLWFSEGFALYNQGLVIYTKEELRKNIEKYNIGYNGKSDNFGTIPKNIRFEYSLYFYFMDYLIEKYGKEKMLVFMNLMIENYRSSEKSFELTFESTIRRELVEFVKKSFDKDLI